jgi:hypothetical protein
MKWIRRLLHALLHDDECRIVRRQVLRSETLVVETKILVRVDVTNWTPTDRAAEMHIGRQIDPGDVNVGGEIAIVHQQDSHSTARHCLLPDHRCSMCTVLIEAPMASTPTTQRTYT